MHLEQDNTVNTQIRRSQKKKKKTIKKWPKDRNGQFVGRKLEQWMKAQVTHAGNQR